MWFFTKQGFYSAVTEERGKHKGKLVVRAREPGALELLRDAYMPELTKTSIGARSDYRYRAWIEREAFAEGMARVARDIDYSNFKSKVASERGLGLYEKLLHQVWSVMGKIQPKGPYGMGGKGFPSVPKGEKATGKVAGGQSTLLTSLSEVDEGACEDCGTKLEPSAGGWYGGRWLCNDLPGCQSRIRAHA